ncbi:G patch domain-containing protein 4 [Embiotoca jacksoni]|uniref:G patch domain-containing protein 4 n=1 Tax=Embiotoca jacksoni TaxID=100190 RepID=UPI0037046E6A
MAEVAPEKSRGLKFAEQQMLRHGWEHGKGLGRAEDGIAEAIKVKVKCGKGGVGHKEGEQFTFHWWDHVFNKASSSLQVESDQNGPKLKKAAEDGEEDTMISNKKPRKASLAKAKLYGCFVKSSTLLSGQEQPEPKSSDSDDSSSSDEEDDRRLDLSSTTQLSDSDLMKACGGRTAHKGARHGLTMSAKLARLEQQEAEFMAKYCKKSRAVASPEVMASPEEVTASPEEETASPEEECGGKKTKKKRRKKTSTEELNGDESPETDDQPKKKMKKKKRASGDDDDDVIYVENDEEERRHKAKKKHKKENEVEGADSPAAEETAELHTDTKEKKKKKKKKKEKPTESNNKESGQSNDAKLEGVGESAAKQKRKKCKKDKQCADSGAKEAELPPKRKKKKSKD